jgi:hypothetical protein
MNNLHHVLGEPLRDRAPARSEEDYELLRKYRDRLGADVIALQEVNGPRAAGLVFPPDQYDLYFSARYLDDLVTGKATHSDPEQRSDRIYTGFAVRRGVFDGVSKRDLPSLGVIHAADGRPVRWGTEILLEKGGKLLRLLSIHLKFGCHDGSLENPTDPDCVTLAAQRAPLEAWIDEAARQVAPFAILGTSTGASIGLTRTTISGARSTMATRPGWIFDGCPSIARPNATPVSRSQSTFWCLTIGPGSWSMRLHSRRSRTIRRIGIRPAARHLTTVQSR